MRHVVEEPVSSNDLAGLAQVRDAITAAGAAGECGYDLIYYARMAPTVDCLHVDVTRCGGITEFQRAAAAAATHGLDVFGHCAPYRQLAGAGAIPKPTPPGVVPRPRPLEHVLFCGTRPATGVGVPDRDSPGTGYTSAAPNGIGSPDPSQSAAMSALPPPPEALESIPDDR